MMGTTKLKAMKMGILTGKINHLTLTTPNLFLLSNSFWLTFHLFNPSSLFSIQPNLPLFFHQPFSMPPLCESPQPMIYSNKYFLPSGDLCIFVKNTMFWVHRYLLACDLETIRYKLEITESDPKNSEYTGNVWTNPLLLQNEFTNPRTFHLLLSIIYNPQYNIYEGYIRQDWFDILYIAISWGFQEIEQLEMHQIELIDDQYDTQPSSVRILRRLPSPTNTEIISSTKEEDNYNDMYVDENPTDLVMRLHEDTQEYSIGI